MKLATVLGSLLFAFAALANEPTENAASIFVKAAMKYNETLFGYPGELSLRPNGEVHEISVNRLLQESSLNPSDFRRDGDYLVSETKACKIQFEHSYIELSKVTYTLFCLDRN